jgi:predicted RNA-binding protein associated with RNAse of E/G family
VNSPTKEVVVEYHRPGKNSIRYRERLVADRPEVKILLLESADAFANVGDRTVLEQGAPIVWFVFPGHWSDVGRFHLADGSFTGWYTNLCTPAVIDDHVWSITDLFLDLWLPARGEPAWLDQDEFDRAVEAGLLEHELVRGALAERARIASLLGRRSWPPQICRQWNLESARRGL